MHPPAKFNRIPLLVELYTFPMLIFLVNDSEGSAVPAPSALFLDNGSIQSSKKSTTGLYKVGEVSKVYGAFINQRGYTIAVRLEYHAIYQSLAICG